MALLAAASFVVAYGIVSTKNRPMPAPQRFALDSVGAVSELVLVILSSCDCAGASDSGFTGAAHSALQRVGRTPGTHTIGVAVDAVPEEGISCLRRLGKFREIAAGHGFLNLVAQMGMANGKDTVLAVPQLILAERTVTRDTTRIFASGMRVIHRSIGAPAIGRFVQDSLDTALRP